ncbi:hypothetical protein F5883DRAFT_469931 [Diaporthe sp. PMI_573]|nr:hypothetical protein F5883DRAFT_469931 [Diaporthaceae sp. PMI_573]
MLRGCPETSKKTTPSRREGVLTKFRLSSSQLTPSTPLPDALKSLTTTGLSRSSITPIQGQSRKRFSTQPKAERGGKPSIEKLGH